MGNGWRAQPVWVEPFHFQVLRQGWPFDASEIFQR
jgi:hypothetical protein